MVKPIALIRIVNGQESQSQRYPIQPNETKSIGRREDNDLVLERDGEISRNHATIEYTNDGLIYIWDNKSLNGTYYHRNNETKEITKKTQLFEEDILLIGKKYRFKIKKINPQTEEKEKQKKATKETDPDIHLD